MKFVSFILLHLRAKIKKIENDLYANLVRFNFYFWKLEFLFMETKYGFLNQIRDKMRKTIVSPPFFNLDIVLFFSLPNFNNNEEN